MSHTSDYFELIHDKAIELIKAGKAFCDDSTGEQMEEQRAKFLPSPHRDDSVETTLALYDEMLKGTDKGKSMALRAKIDYTSKNGTMRDPVIMRYVNIPHNRRALPPLSSAAFLRSDRTGNKYCVYPIYNFACPIVDSHEGVTHALRSNEYHDSEEQYFWVLRAIHSLVFW